ncbi:unnamed protein product [Amoebophrya sp. A120]|nr:unnamed protein product [Amoebophrya sp. A120]|eukprot:GSA120T00014409001.1
MEQEEARDDESPQLVLGPRGSDDVELDGDREQVQETSSSPARRRPPPSIWLVRELKIGLCTEFVPYNARSNAKFLLELLRTTESYKSEHVLAGSQRKSDEPAAQVSRREHLAAAGAPSSGQHLQLPLLRKEPGWAAPATQVLVREKSEFLKYKKGILVAVLAIAQDLQENQVSIVKRRSWLQEQKLAVEGRRAREQKVEDLELHRPWGTNDYTGRSSTWEEAATGVLSAGAGAGAGTTGPFGIYRGGAHDAVSDLPRQQLGSSPAAPHTATPAPAVAALASSSLFLSQHERQVTGESSGKISSGSQQSTISDSTSDHNFDAGAAQHHQTGGEPEQSGGGTTTPGAAGGPASSTMKKTPSHFFLEIRPDYNDQEETQTTTGTTRALKFNTKTGTLRTVPAATVQHQPAGTTLTAEGGSAAAGAAQQVLWAPRRSAYSSRTREALFGEQRFAGQQRRQEGENGFLQVAQEVENQGQEISSPTALLDDLSQQSLVNTPVEQQLQRKAMLPVWIYYLALKLETDVETAELNEFIEKRYAVPASVDEQDEEGAADSRDLVRRRGAVEQLDKEKEKLQKNHTGNDVDLGYVLSVMLRERLTAPRYYDIVAKLHFQLGQERTWMRQQEERELAAANAAAAAGSSFPSSTRRSYASVSSLRRRKRYKEKLELFRKYLEQEKNRQDSEQVMVELPLPNFLAVYIAAVQCRVSKTSCQTDLEALMSTTDTETEQEVLGQDHRSVAVSAPRCSGGVDQKIVHPLDPSLSSASTFVAGMLKQYAVTRVPEVYTPAIGGHEYAHGRSSYRHDAELFYRRIESFYFGFTITVRSLSVRDIADNVPTFSAAWEKLQRESFLVEIQEQTTGRSSGRGGPHGGTTDADHVFFDQEHSFPRKTTLFPVDIEHREREATKTWWHPVHALTGHLPKLLHVEAAVPGFLRTFSKMKNAAGQEVDQGGQQQEPRIDYPALLTRLFAQMSALLQEARRATTTGLEGTRSNDDEPPGGPEQNQAIKPGKTNMMATVLAFKKKCARNFLLQEQILQVRRVILTLCLEEAKQIGFLGGAPPGRRVQLQRMDDFVDEVVPKLHPVKLKFLSLEEVTLKVFRRSERGFVMSDFKQRASVLKQNLRLDRNSPTAFLSDVFAESKEMLLDQQQSRAGDDQRLNEDANALWLRIEVVNKVDVPEFALADEDNVVRHAASSPAENYNYLASSSSASTTTRMADHMHDNSLRRLPQRHNTISGTTASGSGSSHPLLTELAVNIPRRDHRANTDFFGAGTNFGKSSAAGGGASSFSRAQMQQLVNEKEQQQRDIRNWQKEKKKQLQFEWTLLGMLFDFDIDDEVTLNAMGLDIRRKREMLEERMEREAAEEQQREWELQQERESQRGRQDEDRENHTPARPGQEDGATSDIEDAVSVDPEEHDQQQSSRRQESGKKNPLKGFSQTLERDILTLFMLQESFAMKLVDFTRDTQHLCFGLLLDVLFRVFAGSSSSPGRSCSSETAATRAGPLGTRRTSSTSKNKPDEEQSLLELSQALRKMALGEGGGAVVFNRSTSTGGGPQQPPQYCSMSPEMSFIEGKRILQQTADLCMDLNPMLGVLGTTTTTTAAKVVGLFGEAASSNKVSANYPGAAVSPPASSSQPAVNNLLSMQEKLDQLLLLFEQNFPDFFGTSNGSSRAQGGTSTTSSGGAASSVPSSFVGHVRFLPQSRAE